MDDSPNSVSCHDLLYLLRNRFLDVLLIDLQLYGETSAAVNTELLASHRIIGAYALKQLASQLYASPNRGSAVYSIVCNQGLRQLLGQLGCPYLIVYDRDGSADGTAQKFVSMLGEVEKVTGKKRFGGLRMARYLRGGLMKFRSLFPAMCVESLTGGASLSANSADESHTTERLNYPDGPPVDPPSCILNDLLFLSGIQATSTASILQNRFDHVVSLGEVPLAIDPPDERTVLTTIDQHTVSSLSGPQPSSLRSRSSGPPTASYSLIRLHADSGNSSHEFIHYSYPIEDASHAPIHQIFEQTSQIIHQALMNGERVLVHCYGGVSRSSTIVMAYLIKYHYLTLAESFANVFRRRPWVRPNEGFWQRLQEFEIEEHIVRPVRFRRLDLNSLRQQQPHNSLFNTVSRTATVGESPVGIFPPFPFGIADVVGNRSDPDLPKLIITDNDNESSGKRNQSAMFRVNVTAPVRTKTASTKSATAGSDLRRTLLERLISSPAASATAPSPLFAGGSKLTGNQRGMEAQSQQPSGFSEFNSPTVQFFPPNNSFLRNKSRALVILEDDSTADAEGSLTYRVMSSTRLERVEDWVKLCFILRDEPYFV